MGKIRNNQSGFSAVEVMLVLVIVALVSVVGFMVYKNHNKAKPTPVASTATTEQTATNSSTKASQTSQTPTTPAQPQASYLTIKEWGLRVRLSSISDAYYKVSGYDTTGKVADQIDLSLTSLENTQCKAGGWPPAVYFRYTASGTDPVSGKPYTQIDGTAHKIGDYYYAYEDGYGVNKSGGCQSTTDNQAKANAAASAFKAALDTLQPAS